MINAILTGIFNLIISLFNAIVSPFVSAITTLFPALNDFFTHITNFLTTACTYVRSVLALFCINDNMILTIFNYFAIMYSIHIVSLAIKFAINIYNKFKI